MTSAVMVPVASSSASGSTARIWRRAHQGTSTGTPRGSPHRRRSRRRFGPRPLSRLRPPRHQAEQHLDRYPPRAYLTDFGIAAVEEDLLTNVTAVGTLPYMAPEQLDDALGPVDHRADLYALGVTFYELLTGRHPFQAPTTIELRTQILKNDPAPPGSIEPGVPEMLERICLRCLAKNPDDRYAHADEIATDLRAFLETSPD